MQRIGEKIKHERLEKGLSQQELANKLFISKQSISKYENGHSNPSKEVVEKLEEILKTNLQEISNSKFSDLGIKTKYIFFGGVISSAVLIISLIILITGLNNKNDEVTSYSDSLETDILRLEEKLNAKTSILVDLNNTLDELNLDYEELEENNSIIMNNLNTSQDNYDTLNDEFNSLNSRLESILTNNILEYSGVDIIYKNDLNITTHSTMEVGVQIIPHLDTNLFMLQSKLFTVNYKMFGQVEITSKNFDKLFSDLIVTNDSIYNFILSSPIEGALSDYEYIELYYGGMFVALLYTS